jgi:hypothetical protein
LPITGQARLDASASARKAVTAAVGVVVTLVLAGCAAGGATATVSSAPATTSAPAAASSSATDSGSSSPSASVSSGSAASSSPLASATGASTIDLPPLAGYTYTAAPAGFDKIGLSMKDLGIVTSATVKGVVDKSGRSVAALLVAQYNAKVTAALATQPLTKGLDGAVKGSLGFIPGKAKVTTVTLSGTPVRIVAGKGIAIGFAIRKTGVIVEVFGPDATTIQPILGGYLAATA